MSDSAALLARVLAREASGPPVFHWTIAGRPACESLGRPHPHDRPCSSYSRAEIEAYVAAYKDEGYKHEVAVVEGSCPTHLAVLKADVERDAHWKRIEEERRAKPSNLLAKAGGRYHLFRWIGWWVPTGPNHGRDCQFERAEDALEWMAREASLDYHSPKRIRDLYWMDVLGKPISYGMSAFLVVDIPFPVWPPPKPEVQDE